MAFHNLSGYDALLFIREMGKTFDVGKIGLIAENKEKYISFNIDVVVDSYTDDSGEVKEKKIRLRFTDSMRFMASILDSLTNNLVKDGRELTGFKDYSEKQYELLIHKGVYPYEYMSSYDNFDERGFLPRKLSIATLSDISDEDYSHAQKVWKGFGMKNLGNTMIFI